MAVRITAAGATGLRCFCASNRILYLVRIPHPLTAPLTTPPPNTTRITPHICAGVVEVVGVEGELEMFRGRREWPLRWWPMEEEVAGRISGHG